MPKLREYKRNAGINLVPGSESIRAMRYPLKGRDYYYALGALNKRGMYELDHAWDSGCLRILDKDLPPWKDLLTKRCYRDGPGGLVHTITFSVRR